MKKTDRLFEISKIIRTLAQNGLVYSEDEYNTDRYIQLLDLSHEITSILTNTNISEISDFFLPEMDYVTPKVDIRAVVFNEEGKLLLVQEKADNKWALPGGWADVGYTPAEIARKEVKEECGLDVEPYKLLAILDKRCHKHPPHIHYAYKVFIRCKLIGGNFNQVFDILDKGFFNQNNLPELSTDRNTPEQIDLMFDFYKNSDRTVVFD